MKVPPKRKGNSCHPRAYATTPSSLNESPSEKEGKSGWVVVVFAANHPSMKVPPKRKGNVLTVHAPMVNNALNESPSEKEGK